MRYSNLHTHTVFSDGKHTAEENVLSAIEKNMLSLGFSDHSFTACDPSYCMRPDRYDAYRRTVEALKEKYAHQIPVFCGMELDYYSEQVQALDYVIASVHYIIQDGMCYPIDHTPGQQVDCARNAFGGNWLDMARCYYDLLTEHVEKTKPTFVGHFDVITKFSLMPENDDRYIQIAQDALMEVLKVCPYIEVNTGAIARGWRKTPYPRDYLLQTVRENGGKVLLSSDCHDRNNLDFCFDEALAAIKAAGFSSIAVFNGSTFEDVPIE